MPAKSKAQREAMAIAEHHPDELYPENKGMAKMSHQQLHDFAATPEKKLPEHSHKEEKRGMHKDSHHRMGRHAHPRGEQKK